MLSPVLKVQVVTVSLYLETHGNYISAPFILSPAFSLQILVALLKQNKLDASQLRLLCLDEADQLLDTGNKKLIFNLYAQCKKEAQVVICSATLHDRYSHVCRKHICIVYIYIYICIYVQHNTRRYLPECIVD